MEIKDLLERYKTIQPKPIHTSERAELVKKFVERLNYDRVQSGRKALPASVYAIKMANAGLKSNHDLYWFFAYCDEAKNFSATWWWALNPKNVKNNPQI